MMKELKIASKYQCEIIDRPKKISIKFLHEILSWKHAVNIVQKNIQKNFSLFLFLSLHL